MIQFFVRVLDAFIRGIRRRWIRIEQLIYGRSGTEAIELF
ncbi:hypothetical protein MARINON1_50816 [Marinobacter salarius]|nr:conserved hypothetical protein [Marinobacter salarius]VXB59164.1 hypothetical protein MARINON1_50816 [Marinobacter salarius]